MSTRIQNAPLPLRIFYSYAPEDEVLALQIEAHLSSLIHQNLVTIWSSREILSGEDWSQEVNHHLVEADIILLLISSDFLASDYSYGSEIQAALRKHELGESRIVPILLRPVDWQGTPFAYIQALPPDGRPITSYRDRDQAFSDVVKGVRRVCEDIINKKVNNYESLDIRPSSLMKHSLADVFVKSGFPQITFVEPEDFTFLKLALQQPGRGVIIEGPSGVGKTSSVEKIVSDLAQDNQYSNLLITRILSARTPAHRESLKTIREWHQGTVIIDDFHILDVEARHAMVDYLKELADTTSTTKKLAIIGIPRTGQALVDISFDLATRIDVFTFGKVNDNSILEMIRKGEKALNIKFDGKAEIVLAANGSLNLAQFLCFNMCAAAKIIETQVQTCFVRCDIDAAKKLMTIDLGRKFEQTVRQFLALGGSRDLTSLRLLEELVLRSEGSLPLRMLEYTNSQLAQGIERFITEKWIDRLYRVYPEAENHLSFDIGRQILIIDDPQLDFYLKQVRLASLAREVGKFPLLTKRKVFISYSHSDSKWLDRLRKHLAPLEREGVLDLWDDTRISAGQQWEEVLTNAIETARVVVLLVSANFLASDFIIEGELPALLDRARASGTAIIPVILSPSLFNHTNLRMFRAINSPEHPISSMNPDEQEHMFTKVSQTILAHLGEA
ncbi:MAG TPA: TIR domain-containing protein [Ktedonobacteraceae bacterium]|nr:TIR domain-containing protein [Ktedonobacteraceae bacterium]